MKTIYLLFILFLPVFLSAKGTINGKITDTRGDAIPQATIFVKEISLGTTANSDGDYELQLAPGTYNIQFRSMGFIPANYIFEIDTTCKVFNIVLKDQIFQLHEIKVYANSEDQAYPIMRRAISMAPYYLNHVKNYKAEVYIKGTAKLEKIPKILRKNLKININGNNLSEGNLLVGENLSEIEFTAPNTYKQKIISSNMSMMDDSSKTFDLGLITESAYAPEMDYMIMPLSPKAFSYYNFKYEGYSTEGNYVIDKVKLTPKRKSKQLFEGYLYIIEGLWCLYSLDLETEQFFGSVQTQIQFNEVRDDVWLPSSHNIHAEGKMMGIKGRANYTSSVKYRSVVLDEGLAIPQLLSEFITEQKEEETIATEQKTKRQQKIETLMEKKDLTTRDAVKLANLIGKETNEQQQKAKGKEALEIQETYHIETADSSTLRDQEYWAKLRPNPLTLEEQMSYQINDSLAKVIASKPDTLTHKPKKSPLINKIIHGYRFKWQGDSSSLTYKGLISPELLSFNAVEGWKYRQEVSFNKKTDHQHTLNSTAWLGYSFNRQQIQWNLSGNYRYAAMHPSTLSIAGGSNICDYMGDGSISPFINSIWSLFLKENYARYVQQRYFTIGNSRELFNGFDFNLGFAYFDRLQLQNSTNFSFVYPNKTYQTNNIVAPDATIVNTANNNSAILAVGLRYVPFRHYRVQDGRKIPDWSKWPEFSFQYKKGINQMMGSDADWDYLELKINQRIKTGVNSHLTYALRSGIFVNNTNVAFADYAGFRTSNVLVETQSEITRFRMLPFYTYNTDQWFAEVFCNYNNPYILIKYLPWFSERLWKENLQLSYLTQPGYRNYIEAGYYLSDIAAIGNIGVFANFENGKYKQSALRITLRL